MLRIRKVVNSNRKDDGDPVAVVVFEGDILNPENGRIERNIGATIDPIAGHVADPERFAGKVINGAHVERYQLSEAELEKRRENGTDTWETPQGDLVEVKQGTRVSVDNGAAYLKSMEPVLDALYTPEGVSAKS